MAKTTIELLFDQDKLQVGDILEIDQQRFYRSRKVPDKSIRDRADDAEFWHCSVTERTRSSGEVKWHYNSQYYRPTALVNVIAEGLTDEDYSPSEIGYWTHPRYDGTNLWDLREE